MPQGVRALVFDFDGVIADTESLHFETLASVLSEEGIVLTREVNDRDYIGIDVWESFKKAFADADRSLPPDLLMELTRRKSSRFVSALEKVRLFPGCRKLVREAASRFPCAIASGTLRDEILAVLRSHDLESCFVGLVTADDELPSKPSPHTYRHALRILQETRAPDLQASECLAIEDSVPGIFAAKAAGMSCVAVAHSHPAAQLGRADVVLESLEGWDWSGLP